MENLMSRRSPTVRRFGLSCSPARTVVEPLERRRLLAVTFAAAPYAVPSNRPDQILAPILPSGFPEVPIKTNPRDPANVVAFGGLMAYSTNALATFTAPVVPPLPPGFTNNGGDGDLEFDVQGRLFTSHLVSAGPGTGTSRVAVGQWDPTTGTLLGSLSIIPSTPGQRNDDKPFIVTDTNPASPHLNSIYAVWDRFNVTASQWEVFFARSTDQGQNWTGLQQLSHFYGPNQIPGDADDEGLCWPSDVAVAPNGDVYVTYHSQRDMNAQTLELNGQRVNPDGVSGKTIIRRSTDGGLKFGPVTEVFAAGASDVTFNTQDALNGGNIPSTQFLTVGSATAYVLADPVRPANVYVITSDDPDNVHGTGDDADVVFARSTDHGQTWTRSTVVSGPANSFQLFPFTAIDRSGNLVLAWVDNRRGQTNASGRYLLDFMATYSTDGGVTWAPEFRLSDIGFDPDPNPVVRFAGPPPTTRIGEYFGIDLNGGTAHLIIDANFFSGPKPAGQAVTHTTFALAGALTVTGGPGDDVISINPLTGSPGNPEFVEVFVNGVREYAGLFEGLSGITIDAGGGTDTINVANTGAALPITILPSAGEDVVSVNVAGAGAASVAFAETMRLGALTVGTGGATRLAPGGGLALTLGSLALTGSGALDVADNSLIVDYTGPSPLTQVRAALTSGYVGGLWNGAGINSSAAAATPARALGYAEATDLFTTFPAPFAAQQVDDTSVLVTYTRYGDADLTRSVNLNDFNRLAANFGQGNRRWSHGDFTFDGLVNLDDFNRLASNFGQAAGTAPANHPIAVDRGEADEELEQLT
jgi:hypothetical protein